MHMYSMNPSIYCTGLAGHEKDHFLGKEDVILPDYLVRLSPAESPISAASSCDLT